MWSLGIGLAIFSAGCTNLGINLQKLSYEDYYVDLNEHAYRVYHSYIWIVGIVMMMFGSIIDFIALGVAPQSVIAPFGAFSLVFNVIIAKILHYEPITLQTLTGTSLIIIGTVFCSICATHIEETLTLAEIIDLTHSHVFIATTIFMVMAISMIWRYACIVEENTYYHKLSITFLTGVFGAYNLLIGKILCKLLFINFQQLYTSVFAYTIVFLLITTMIIQLIWLNYGLKLYTSTSIIPMTRAFWVIFSVILGMITFIEYKTLTLTYIILFYTGIIIVVTGIVFFLINDEL
jgi:uncharacterized membrane protein